MPRVKVDSENISVDYGSHIKLTCSASVYKFLENINITVAWLKRGETLKQIITMSSLHNFAFTLTLRNVTSAGHYVCWIKLDNQLDTQTFEDSTTVFVAGKISQ